METTFFLNQHNFLITTGMTLFFIYLRKELKISRDRNDQVGGPVRSKSFFLVVRFFIMIF